MKQNYKSNNNKKAFTLIELLIVIAIIGILFIVLVSRVDFATDKAKATGVQTDFRSFQVAFDQVAKENAGFNIFGWDTGDANGDRIRNSYDRGDTNKNGKEDPGETFIGRKNYGETWTSVYTMLNPDTTKPNDTSAFVALEQAINANLDPKLHITITPDVDGGALTGNATITMANQARDPWKNEYHGVFITNAARDNGADRGAIIMYSNGANGEWGSGHDIANGIVSITVPGNNKLGQDDYSIVSCYTYVNGYGEVKNITTGFSNNQQFLVGGASSGGADVTPTPDPAPTPVHECESVCPECGKCLDTTCSENACTAKCEGHPVVIQGSATFTDGTTLTWEELKLTDNGTKYGYNAVKITGDSIGYGTFFGCETLTSLIIPEGITSIGGEAFFGCGSLTNIKLPDSLTTIGDFAFQCAPIENINFPNGITNIGEATFTGTPLTNVDLPDSLTSIGKDTFNSCLYLQSIDIPASVTSIGKNAFTFCYLLTNITFNGTTTQWNDIQKGNEWNMGCYEIKVICTNGTITIPANESP